MHKIRVDEPTAHSSDHLQTQPREADRGRWVSILEPLDQARRMAEDVDHDLWEFALEIQELRSLGTTSSDLRWLMCRGLIRHALDFSPVDDQRRFCCPTSRLKFSKRSCFVITDAGCDYLKVFESDRTRPESTVPPHHLAADIHADSENQFAAKTSQPLPVWNESLRELRFDGQIVKQFRVPAEIQQTILSAFQEEGWPASVSDPLAPDKGMSP